MSKLGKILKILRRLKEEGKIVESIYTQSCGSSWRVMSGSRLAYLEERSSRMYWDEEDYTFYMGIGGILSGIFSNLENIKEEMTKVFSEANPDKIEIKEELNCVEMTFKEVVATITVNEECVLSPEEKDLIGDRVFASLWEGFDQDGRLIYKETGTKFLKQTASPTRSVLLQIYPSGRGARGAYIEFMEERKRCQESSF
ncbi:MAG: hypothetical protein WC998_03805 [Candidatus Paceibacterota bacterium]|jgi:hypothetical protein